MQRVIRPVILVSLAILAGCSQTDDTTTVGSDILAYPPPSSAAVVFASNLYGESPGYPRELFAINLDGSGLTQLTSMSSYAEPFDTLEASPASNRVRAAVRRVYPESDSANLVFVDLARRVQAELVASTVRVSGIDWSPSGDVLGYSGTGAGGLDDLYVVNWNGTNQGPLTQTQDIQERRPRIDPTGTIAVFERIGPSRKGEVWIFQSSSQQVQVTSGGPGTESLAGTLYVVGSDADPCFSPDGQFVVFRRLSSTGMGGLGNWDVLTVRTDGSALYAITSGDAYRGAPDWGPNGIVFEEVDSSETRLVLVQPDGSGRRVMLSRPAGFAIQNPRWLR